MNDVFVVHILQRGDALLGVVGCLLLTEFHLCYEKIYILSQLPEQTLVAIFQDQVNVL